MSKSKTKREIWTQEMDDALIDAFLHQQNDGNKVSGSFTSKAYETIIKELQQKFGRSFEKEKIKSRWKIVKRRFSKCYDLFKNGLSGFAWDPITKQWCAEPEVWQKLIEAKPEAKEWMGKSIPNYDKLMIVCGGDRATGQHAETAKDIRNKRSLPCESESIETIDVTLESAQEVGNENEVTSLDVQDTRSQEVKSKRAKRSKDEEVEGIQVALQDIAGALKEGNAAIHNT
ncbi:uncharacterized protein At2g29880-like [Gastrolobium bilobum]|uniref:uncharacterized protein At2g29880-like n=1 Tax=Gastrolobium bilobum TaxID=150636 RepID=UPI002AB1C74D|nr:uncharacterized protein At2g29880-like [Gastrolobium bilobum]